MISHIISCTPEKKWNIIYDITYDIIHNVMISYNFVMSYMISHMISYMMFRYLMWYHKWHIVFVFLRFRHCKSSGWPPGARCKWFWIRSVHGLHRSTWFCRSKSWSGWSWQPWQYKRSKSCNPGCNLEIYPRMHRVRGYWEYIWPSPTSGRSTSSHQDCARSDSSEFPKLYDIIIWHHTWYHSMISCYSCMIS